MANRARRQADISKLMVSGYEVLQQEPSSASSDTSMASTSRPKGPKDLFNQPFFVILPGPKDSPYSEGVFKVSVELPQNYPFQSPSVGFEKHSIWHPNVCYSSGSVCLDVLNSMWTPMYSLVNVFEQFLPYLLTHPNSSDPLNSEAAVMQSRDVRSYENKCREAVRNMMIRKGLSIVAKNEDGGNENVMGNDDHGNESDNINSNNSNLNSNLNGLSTVKNNLSKDSLNIDINLNQMDQDMGININNLNHNINIESKTAAQAAINSPQSALFNDGTLSPLSNCGILGITDGPISTLNNRSRQPSVTLSEGSGSQGCQWQGLCSSGGEESNYEFELNCQSDTNYSQGPNLNFGSNSLNQNESHFQQSNTSNTSNTNSLNTNSAFNQTNLNQLNQLQSMNQNFNQFTSLSFNLPSCNYSRRLLTLSDTNSNRGVCSGGGSDWEGTTNFGLTGFVNDDEDEMDREFD